MSFGVRVIPTVRVVSSLLVSTTPLSHRYFIYISSLHTRRGEAALPNEARHYQHHNTPQHLTSTDPTQS